jgi:predicted alpha/beta-fold hydrolase
VPLKRSFFKFKDEGTGTLDWGPIHNSFEETDEMPIVIIFPGLTGNY